MWTQGVHKTNFVVQSSFWVISKLYLKRSSATLKILKLPGPIKKPLRENDFPLEILFFIGDLITAENVFQSYQKLFSVFTILVKFFFSRLLREFNLNMIKKLFWADFLNKNVTKNSIILVLLEQFRPKKFSEVIFRIFLLKFP